MGRSAVRAVVPLKPRQHLSCVGWMQQLLLVEGNMQKRGIEIIKMKNQMHGREVSHIFLYEPASDICTTRWTAGLENHV